MDIELYINQSFSNPLSGVNVKGDASYELLSLSVFIERGSSTLIREVKSSSEPLASISAASNVSLR